METPHMQYQPQQSQQAPTPKRSTTGPVIGIVVVLAMIVVGVLYFWGERVDTLNKNRELLQKGADTQVEQLQTQSASDDLTSIEADLDATDINAIDTGISN